MLSSPWSCSFLKRKRCRNWRRGNRWSWGMVSFPPWCNSKRGANFSNRWRKNSGPWWRSRVYSLVVVVASKTSSPLPVFVWYDYKFRQASDWFWCCCREPSSHCMHTSDGRWPSVILHIGILRSLICTILSVSSLEYSTSADSLRRGTSISKSSHRGINDTR